MKINKLLISTLLLCQFLLSSCGDDVIPNESELITSVYLDLSDTSSHQNITLEFVDPDGSGGQAPIVKSPALKANALYLGRIRVLNESVSPPVDISEEVKSERETHQFFYIASNPDLLEIRYLDSDANGRPLGSDFSFKTHQTGQTKLKIVLRHEPDKNAPGVAEGDLTNAGGETDLEIEFDIVIQ